MPRPGCAQPVSVRSGTVTAVEEIDRRIVDLLAESGRMSYTDLARATGLSSSAAHARVRKLEERGVIRGYGAIIDADAVGRPLAAFISCRPFDASAADDLPERVRDIPEIESCYSVAGEANYILKVRVGTPGDLEALLATVRAKADVSTYTTIVLSTPFENRWRTG